MRERDHRCASQEGRRIGMGEDNELAISPYSLSRMRIEELKKTLIELVRKECLDFYMSLPGCKLISDEHFEFVKLLIKLELLIDSV